MPSVLEAVLSRLTAAELSPSDGLVVGVSGGPDSQCLLDALARLQQRGHVGPLQAVGIDHGLRPAAADELERASTLAQAHGIRFTTVKVQVDRTGNRLAAARRARLGALELARQAAHARFVVLAHTATDQLETVLMRLVRGSATRGLAGIAPRRGPFLHPLLDVPRAQVMRYLARRALPFAEDPSNGDLSTARGWLRARVLPELRHLNPEVEAAVGRAVAALAADEALLGALADAQRQPNPDEATGLVTRQLSRAPAVRTRMLRSERELADQPICEAALRPTQPKRRLGPPRSQALEPGTTIRLARLDSRLRCSIAALPAERLGTAAAGTPASDFDGHTAVAFDVAGIHLPFVVRAAKLSERFKPFGSTGRTRVADVLRSAGIEAGRRRGWPVVEAGGEIVWVVGLRRGSVAPITASTRRIATLSLEAAGSWRA